MKRKRSGSKAIAMLINDIHLDKDNGELVKDIFRQAVEECKSRDCFRIICGGDVFTNRSGQPLSCLIDFKDIIEYLDANDIEFYSISGNHDKTAGDDDRSYLDVFDDSRSFHLYKYGSEPLYLDGVVFGLIPYFRDEKWLERYEELMEEINSNPENNGAVKILVTHIGFDGVVNNDGSKVSSVIKPSMFSEWDKVLIGHYHNQSELCDNVIYTGSAYQNNFGENITDKGFTFIYGDGSLKFVQSKFPKYIKEVIQADDKDTLRNLLEIYDGEDYDHIRFVFQGKQTDLDKIDVNHIKNHYGIDVKFESSESANAMEVSEGDGLMSYDAKTIKTDFLKFCGENEIRGEKLKYGINLINELKNVES